jgi:hypothetical protein
MEIPRFFLWIETWKLLVFQYFFSFSQFFWDVPMDLIVKPTRCTLPGKRRTVNARLPGCKRCSAERNLKSNGTEKAW